MARVKPTPAGKGQPGQTAACSDSCASVSTLAVALFDAPPACRWSPQPLVERPHLGFSGLRSALFPDRGNPLLVSEGQKSLARRVNLAGERSLQRFVVQVRPNTLAFCRIGLSFFPSSTRRSRSAGAASLHLQGDDQASSRWPGGQISAAGPCWRRCGQAPVRLP